MDMHNPLLDTTLLPQFSKIRPEHIEPAVDQLLADCRQTIDDCLRHGAPYTWDNLVAPISDAEDRLNKAWSPVGHMNAVINSEALRL
jgi:oligopeptidase A